MSVLKSGHTAVLKRGHTAVLNSNTPSLKSSDTPVQQKQTRQYHSGYACTPGLTRGSAGTTQQVLEEAARRHAQSVKEALGEVEGREQRFESTVKREEAREQEVHAAQAKAVADARAQVSAAAVVVLPRLCYAVSGIMLCGCWAVSGIALCMC
eukprot:15330-Rhodomonas_salina.4